MASTARGLRLNVELEEEISQEADRRGQSWSVLAKEMLGESLRMRRVPGIAFADGATGRRAILAGTGLDVWEVISTWKSEGQDFERLAESYPWLSEPQLRAAVGYYQLYSIEIDARLRREAEWTPERVQREFPFLVAAEKASSRQ